MEGDSSRRGPEHGVREGAENLTEITLILDRSGSMAPVTETAITGFNEFLRNHQKTEGQARLTFVLFDNE